MKTRVASVEAPDPGRVRFKLREPWPDFLTFYSSATGAGWIVPRKYVEKVGEAGFKQAPIGAGPYKFVSFTPGVELVLEAFDQFWRKPPGVKRLVFKVIPDEATRVAALKGREVDIAYSIRGELAEDIQQTPGLTLKPTVGSAPYWVYFPEQWDPRSPWHDVRVRQAASLAINRENINRALTLGHSHLTGSVMPENLEFFWQPPKPVFDLEKARQLLAEAGYKNGFDAGEYICDAAYANLGEAVLNDLQTAGIRARLRPLERAAFFKGYAEKKFNKGMIQGASGAFGNAATRLEVVCRQGRRVRLWQLSGHRRVVSETGRRAGNRQAPRAVGQDAAAAIREGNLRPDLAARLYQRGRSAGRRIRVRAHQGLCVHRPLRRPDPEREAGVI